MRNQITQQAFIALAQRCAGLNTNLPQIGHGMLVTIQAEATNALELLQRETDATSHGGSPINGGKAWTAFEDSQLVERYDNGRSIAECGQLHGRSKWAIEARLARLGKIPNPPTRFPVRA